MENKLKKKRKNNFHSPFFMIYVRLNKLQFYLYSIFVGSYSIGTLKSFEFFCLQDFLKIEKLSFMQARLRHFISFMPFS